MQETDGDAGSVDERADVFADAICHDDVEAGLCRHVEILTARVGRFDIAGVQLHLTGAGDDLHALGLVRAEVEAARIDQTQGLFAAIRKQDAVADHLAVEIHVGFGDGGDVGELGRNS